MINFNLNCTHFRCNYWIAYFEPWRSKLKKIGREYRGSAPWCDRIDGSQEDGCALAHALCAPLCASRSALTKKFQKACTLAWHVMRPCMWQRHWIIVGLFCNQCGPHIRCLRRPINTSFNDKFQSGGRREKPSTARQFHQSFKRKRIFVQSKKMKILKSFLISLLVFSYVMN